MAVQHICGEMAYRLAYQRKIMPEVAPKYFNTNRYYCESCDVILKVVEEH